MNKKFILKTCGVVLIIVAIAAFGLLMFNQKNNNTPLVFAERTMLNALWASYKDEYWEASSGRTLDRQQNDITTSEGQSYTMLRAVWVSDKPTFDQTWKFTKEQLQHDDDSLFSWRWGEKADGTFGVLTDQGGQNAASDAEVDIALALLMAAERWQQMAYLDEAKRIINDTWEKEVVTVNGSHYLAANDLEKFSENDTAIINPSYFAPYAFKAFAKVDEDKSHDWEKLATDSYAILNQSIDLALDKETSAGLPPDWMLVNKQTGEITAANQPNLTTNYSYDALRTPWRIALDWQWNKDPRAKATLQKMSFLGEQWQQNQTLYSTYSHDGQTLVRDEVPAMYGGAIGFFSVIDPETARIIYETKLKSLYDPTNERWNQNVSYYSDNWAWFGMALYQEDLDNLVKDL